MRTADLRRLEIDEIKEIELSILHEFADFCEIHGLKYYLAGGTLLGAIRHNGFIPWDDDIDLCMPRPDYERLILYWSNDDSRCQLKCERLGNFIAPFAKVIDPRTRVEMEYTQGGLDDALWIDVFPVDGLPCDMHEVAEIYEKEAAYRKMLMLADARLGRGRNGARALAKFVLKPAVNIYGKQRISEKMRDLALKHSYEDSQYVGSVTWGLYGVGERMLKEEFEQSFEVEFEGRRFMTFSCWDSYLSGHYGEYMEFPPKEQQVLHEMTAYIEE